MKILTASDEGFLVRRGMAPELVAAVDDLLGVYVAAERQRIIAHFEKWQAKAGAGERVPWQIIFIDDGPLTDVDRARGREVASLLGIDPDFTGDVPTDEYAKRHWKGGGA